MATGLKNRQHYSGDQDQNKHQGYYDSEFSKSKDSSNHSKDAEDPTKSLNQTESEPTTQAVNPLDNQEASPYDDFYKDKFDPTKISGQTGETDLEKLEKKPDSQERNIGQDEKNGLADAGGLYDAGGETGGTSKIKGAVQGAMSGKKKYGWIGGGLAGIVIALFGTFMLSFSPVHIFQNFLRHNFDYNDSFGRDRTGKIMTSIFKRNKIGWNLKDTPFKTKADLIEWNKFEKRMSLKGWAFSYDVNTKKPVALIDSSGNVKNLDGLSKAEFKKTIQPLIDDTIPAWRMNKRIRTRNLITTFSGPKASFKWRSLFSRAAKEKTDNFETRRFLLETGKEVTVDVDGKIREQVFNEDGSPRLDENGNPVYKESGSGSAIDEARSATVEAKLNGATDAEALSVGTLRMQDGIRTGAGKSGSIILVGAVAGCIAYGVYEQDLIGDFQRYASAMRIGATFMLGTNEIMEGDVADAEEVGKFFSEYNTDNFKEQILDEKGDPVLDEQGNPTFKTSSKTFATSAGWQRAVGDKPVGPELDSELHVIKQDSSDGMVQKILTGGGSFVASMPGFSTVCKILNSGIGMVVGYALDALEVIVACIGGVGVGCAVAAGKWAAIEGMFYAVGRILAASLTNFVGFLIANPEQSANFLDQSLSLISTEESRTGKPVSNPQYNAAVAKYFIEENKSQPVNQRFFALENIRSLASRLAIMKMDLSNMNPSQLLTSLFTFPEKTVLAVVNSGNVHAATDLIEFKNYGFQKYSYDNTYLDSDPVDLAEEVYDLIQADTNIVNKDSGVNSSVNLYRDFAVLCMGYNPGSGEVNKSLGTTMLPQFSDPEAIGEGEATRKNKLFQKLCIDEAGNRPEEYAKIGRYVNDIELVTSISELSEEIEQLQ